MGALFDFVREINTLSGSSSRSALEQAAKTFDELTGVLEMCIRDRSLSLEIRFSVLKLFMALGTGALLCTIGTLCPGRKLAYLIQSSIFGLRVF